MDFSYLSFTNSDTAPIECKNPAKKLSQQYNIEDAADFLVSFHKNKSIKNKSFDKDTEHWLDRKWQVCLDYYLSSTLHAKPYPSSVSHIPQKVDFILPRKKVKELSTPIEALINRKTIRKFQEKPLKLGIFSQLLTRLQKELFPDEIWKHSLVVFNVSNIPPGVYEYQLQEHGLSLIKQGIFREKAVKLLCGMSACLSASFLIVFSINIQKALQSYPYSRALRELYIDAGMLAQKLLIKGMQHNVGALPSPAMHDTDMCSFLQIHPNTCIPLYTLTMGLSPGRNISKQERT